MHNQRDTLRFEIEKLMTEKMCGVLATCGDEYPYTSLVGFVMCEDLASILFATSRATHKYTFLKKNPRVSILIDSQTNTPKDFEEAAALTVLGEARDVESAKYDYYRELYLERHPQLVDFISHPESSLMKISVHKYIFVTRFEEVCEYIIPR
jgi:nitroimidazol reductase NimA-like FMN-containing flavoprotein (pyridoxamine 5'-phosphate oxidase superfamily)